MPIEPTARGAPPAAQPDPADFDALLDEALTETFPASDPISIEFTRRTWGRRDAAPRAGADGAASPDRAERSNLAVEQRFDYWKAAPQGMGAFSRLQRYVDDSGLEHSLLELVKTRASQINGCAYCIDMHTKDARRAGETEQRLYALSAWRETPFYTDRERAALAWTEALTAIADDHPDDALYEEVRRHFSEKETVDLTLAIIAINGWNRLAVPFRTPAGSYQPADAGDGQAAR